MFDPMPAFRRVATNCAIAARYFEHVDRGCDSQITDGVHGDLQPGTVGCEYNGLQSVAVPYQLADLPVRIRLPQRCGARVDRSVEDQLDASNCDRVAVVRSGELDGFFDLCEFVLRLSGSTDQPMGDDPQAGWLAVERSPDGRERVVVQRHVDDCRGPGLLI